MSERPKDYQDMNFDQAVALSIQILEYYCDHDIDAEGFFTYKERYEYMVTLRNAIQELRTYLKYNRQKFCLT